MRLRVEVATTPAELPWSRVLAPGRGLAYTLLAEAAPDLAGQLHDVGWGRHGMVPFGYSPPVFPDSPRRRGSYLVGGKGFLELGSPLPSLVEAWCRALQARDTLDWDGTPLGIIDAYVIDPPSLRAGQVRMRTDTPVVLKSSAQPASGGGTPKRSWLLPAEAEFPAQLQHNLRRKAETLGLPPAVELSAVTWAGPKRSFADGGGMKPGAAVEVELYGEPRTLRAIWSWGLGHSNSAGFGWIGVAR